MNIIRLFDKEFNFLYSSSDFSQIQADIKYSAKSTLEFCVDAGSDAAHFVLPGNIVEFYYKGVFYPFIIIKKAINNDIINISCDSPQCLLEQRITVPNAGEYAVAANGSPDYVVKYMINSCISGATRTLPVLTAPTSSGSTVYEQSRYKNLGSEIERICTAYSVGIKWALDVDKRVFVFDTYNGVDRSIGNTGGNAVCIFSEKYKNLENYKYGFDSSRETTTAYAAGAGEGVDREIEVVGGGATGIDRKEVFVDARDVKPGDTNLLIERGKSAIIKLTETISASEAQQSNLVYGEDYNLGDVVTIELGVPAYALENGYYDFSTDKKRSNQRITEVIITFEENAAYVDMVYGELPQTYSSKINQSISQLQTSDQWIMNDYVVDNGVNNGWTYRKWGSGKYELWINKNLGSVELSYNSGYDVYYAGLSVPLPSDVSTVITAVVTPRTNGYCSGAISGISRSAIEYRLLSQTPLNPDVYYCAYVVATY